MNETLRDGAIAIFGFALLSNLLGQRTQHAIVHDLSYTARGGHLQARVYPRGMFGSLLGQASSVRVTGSGVVVDALPFEIKPGGGMHATVGKFYLDLSDVKLKSIPVQRFTAEIPSVSVDSDALIMRERMVMRSAGVGTTESTFRISDLQTYFAAKMGGMKDASVECVDGGLKIRTSMSFLGFPTAIEAFGKLNAVDGRYLVFNASRLTFNGADANPLFAKSMLDSINPVLDIQRDLGLGAYLALTDVETKEGAVIVKSKLTIPAR